MYIHSNIYFLINTVMFSKYPFFQLQCSKIQCLRQHRVWVSNFFPNLQGFIPANVVDEEFFTAWRLSLNFKNCYDIKHFQNITGKQVIIFGRECNRLGFPSIAQNNFAIKRFAQILDIERDWERFSFIAQNVSKDVFRQVRLLQLILIMDPR